MIPEYNKNMEKFLYILVLLNTFFCKETSAYLEIENEDSLPNHALDQQLYEDVLDPELCRQQINYLLRNNTILLARFFDAGIRTPKGILEGNFLDMGNYHQCLGIQETLSDLSIDGKYCMINVPINQDLNFPTLPDWPNFDWPDIPWPELNPKTTRIISETLNRARKLRSLHTVDAAGRRPLTSRLADQRLSLAICIPKACTTREAFDGLMFNSTALGFKYEDDFCRLPNDKPWVVADYLAFVVFGIIGILIILSTAYDLRHNIFLQNDPKQINKLQSIRLPRLTVLQSFSVYTNTRRLVTYTPVPGTIECLDGIRVIGITWIIVGHTYVTQFNDMVANPVDVINWIITFGSLWITTSPIAVDTFFTISGLLVVYTTAGKLTRMGLVKNIHLFYLNRLLRMFPILAAVILLQASIFNWVADGPFWGTVAESTNACRVFWWSTLLHVQNFVNGRVVCLPSTWYLAIDVQLHILSPLVLFWVLGVKKRTAWIALTVAMIAALVPATIYNVINEFPGTSLSFSRTPEEQNDYMIYYYINTLTRCSPFFVGMIYGYLLHLNRGKIVVMSKFNVAVLWLFAVILSSAVITSTYPIMQFDWDNQAVDTIINSVSRPAWALAIGWMIFACAHGYGGAINWILSLRLWKFPSRLSYAMYIVHFNMIVVINGTAIAPVHFTVFKIFYRAFADIVLTFVLSYVLTVSVDSPCSTLIKHFLGGGLKKQQKPSVGDTNDDQLNGKTNPAYISDEKNVAIKLQ